jgi:hypothetical protein
MRGSDHSAPNAHSRNRSIRIRSHHCTFPRKRGTYLPEFWAAEREALLSPRRHHISLGEQVRQHLAADESAFTPPDPELRDLVLKGVVAEHAARVVSHRMGRATKTVTKSHVRVLRAAPDSDGTDCTVSFDQLLPGFSDEGETAYEALLSNARTPCRTPRDVQVPAPSPVAESSLGSSLRPL